METLQINKKDALKAYEEATPKGKAKTMNRKGNLFNEISKAGN